MGETTLTTQASRPGQPQKPTSIKILQWVYLLIAALLGVVLLFDLSDGSLIDLSAGITVALFLAYLYLFQLVSSYSFQSLKIANTINNIVAATIILFNVIFLVWSVIFSQANNVGFAGVALLIVIIFIWGISLLFLVLNIIAYFIFKREMRKLEVF